MTDGDQLYQFLVCASCGIASGVIYDALYCLRTALRGRAVTVVCDILFFLLLACGYLFLSLLFGFPDLRPYLLLGLLLGLLLYLKSFHEIVAFFVKKVYNKVTKEKQRKDEEQAYAE